eukprot:1305191-Prymnesium_polylepis.1
MQARFKRRLQRPRHDAFSRMIPKTARLGDDAQFTASLEPLFDTLINDARLLKANMKWMATQLAEVERAERDDDDEDTGYDSDSDLAGHLDFAQRQERRLAQYKRLSCKRERSGAELQTLCRTIAALSAASKELREVAAVCLGVDVSGSFTTIYSEFLGLSGRCQACFRLPSTSLRWAFGPLA